MRPTCLPCYSALAPRTRSRPPSRLRRHLASWSEHFVLHCFGILLLAFASLAVPPELPAQAAATVSLTHVTGRLQARPCALVARAIAPREAKPLLPYLIGMFLSRHLHACVIGRNFAIRRAFPLIGAANRSHALSIATDAPGHPIQAQCAHEGFDFLIRRGQWEIKLAAR